MKVVRRAHKAMTVSQHSICKDQTQYFTSLDLLVGPTDEEGTRLPSVFCSLLLTW